MPVYQYEGNHYDLPDGLSNEQAIDKIKAHLGQTNERSSLGEKSLGMLEAGASMVAGLPSQIAGGLMGLSKLAATGDINQAADTSNAVQESNFGAGRYTPFTASGKKYSENLGEALNKPVEIAGNVGGKIGEFLGNENVGRTSGELAAGTAMALIDPLIGFKGAKALIDRAGRPSVEPVQKPNASKLAELEAKLADNTQPVLKGQGELFPETLTDTTGHASQIVPPNFEPTTPLRQRRQMELQFPEDTLNVDSNGVSTKGLPDEATVLAREAADAKKPVDLIQGTQADLFEPYTNSHRAFDQFGNEQKPLSFDEYKATVKNLAEEPSTRFQAPEDLKQGYQQYLDSINEKQGGLLDTGSRQEAFKEALYQDTVPQRASEHPFVKAAEARLEKASNILEKVKADVESGKLVPTHLIRAERDVAQLQSKADLARTNIETSLRNRETPSFNTKTRKQGGGVLWDWGSRKNEEFLKKVPGFKENLKNLLPDERTPEQFIEQEKNTPDVSQNLIQKGFNYLTKGGVYQTLKTNNPLIKRGVDRFLDADNRAKAMIQEVVHDGYAPTFRNLSKQERTDVWAVIDLMDRYGDTRPIEDLKAAGMNDRQLNAIKVHQEAMDKSYNQLAAAMEAAGIPAVSKRTAYAAFRARGDFRKVFYEERLNKQTGKMEKSPIGIVGANTRKGLENSVARLKQKFPDAIVGKERYYGGTQSRAGTEAGFSQALEFLTRDDPRMKEFVDAVNDLVSEDAFNYMNAKSHTMQKKGVWGMEGRNLLKTAEQNAKDGLEAQTRNLETMIKWGELSKAVDDIKPLLDKDNGINMPNAKAYLKDYIDNALGKNPTELGRALENVFGTMGKTSGIGTTIPTKVMSGAKSLVNGLLLGWINVPFLAANAIQPFKAMPEMKAYLESKGAKTSFDLGTGYSYMAKAALDMQKERFGGKLDPITQGALKYAKENHVYSSDLFESGNSIKKDVPYYWNQGTQFGAAQVEQVTRKNIYLAMTKLLHDQGITPDDGLYMAARRVTDMAMNNYSQLEAPLAYNALGGMGRMSYNLQSYKHNELSRLSMFARELGENKDFKSAKPLLTALATQVASAGIKGTVLYNEANEIIKYISNKLGEPTSLTKILLDSKVSDNLKFGIFNEAGLDMTSRLGLNVAPNSMLDMLAPGQSKLATAGGAIAKAVTEPSEYNTKNAIRESVPLSVTGLLDKAWFTGKDAQGNNLSINRNKLEANAVRNEADNFWKNFGATGINESKQKAAKYENDQIDLAYQQKRTSIMNQVAQNYFTSGKIDPDLIKKYVAAQGDPSTLENDLQTMATKQKVPSNTLALLRAATSNSITSLHKTSRMLGKE